MACAGSVPGIEPTPVALATGHGNTLSAAVSCTVLSLVVRRMLLWLTFRAAPAPVTVRRGRSPALAPDLR